MSAPELSRPIRLDTIGDGRAVAVEADADERAALVRRFELVALDTLTADWRLRPLASGVAAGGRLSATGAQACVVTGEPVPFALTAAVTLRFAEPGRSVPDQEVELTADELDELPLEGGQIDLGEATAQSLALELDPYPRAADADRQRRDLGIATEVEASPFAALLGLKTT